MKGSTRRDYTNYVLALVAISLAIVSWRQGGYDKVIQGIATGGKLLFSVIPLLISAFLIAGLIQVLISKELVSRWLGSRSGWRGIAIASLSGALIPGGPYVYYPIAAALLKSGAGFGVLISFISGKHLWALSRLPLEFALLGSRLTIIRFLVTLIIPPLIGFLAETLFGKRIDSIREGISSNVE